MHRDRASRVVRNWVEDPKPFMSRSLIHTQPWSQWPKLSPSDNDLQASLRNEFGWFNPIAECPHPQPSLWLALINPMAGRQASP